MSVAFDPTAVIACLRAKGVYLWCQGDKLYFDAPGEALDDAELEVLREHKRAFISALAAGKRHAVTGWQALPAMRADDEADMLIGPPGTYTLVRGPGHVPEYVRSTAIPAWAAEYHVANACWQPLPEHWRPEAAE